MIRKLMTCAVVALMVGACARTEEAADTTQLDTAAAAITPVPAPSPTETAPAAGARRTVHVRLSEWRVAPEMSSIPAGAVTFHVMNEGQYVHALEVERGDSEWETARIQPGGTATLELDLTAGSYTLYCPVEDARGNHRQRGMQTTVTVP